MTSPGCPAEQQLVQGVENEVVENHRQAGDIVGQADFDELLHSNVLDTLADFDFSGVYMSGLEPDAKIVCSPGGTRKRTFSVSEAWDYLSPKISNAMLAGAWENAAAAGPQQHLDHDDSSTGQAGRRRLMAEERTRQRQQSSSPSVVSGDDRYSSGNGAPQQSSAPFRNRSLDDEEVAAVQQVDAPTNMPTVSQSITQESGALAGGKRKSQSMSGGVKRPLNPDRMERKASREKRRREEVNEKFEQLLVVLEEAEATSGLASPVSEHGQLGACVNGRRVEVLSRTISILRTLLRERRKRSAGDTAAAAPICFEHVPYTSPHRTSAEEEADVIGAPRPSAATFPSTGDSPPMKHETCNALAPSFHAASSPHSSAVTSVLGVPAVASAAPPAAPPIPSAGTVQHVAIPVHQHPHAAAMAIPPGFAMAHHHAGMVMSTGMSPGQMAAGAAHMQASVHSMHQHAGIQGHHHSQPFFIAVPMYMPSGPAQGVVAPPVATGCAVASNAAAASQAATPAPAATAPAADAAGTATRSSAEGRPCVPEKPGVAAFGKDRWPMPGAVGFPPMMLQMPQFVMQALSAEDGDEKVTHAMCA